MEIKIINKVNRDARSIYTLKLGKDEFPLNEHQWEELVYQLNIYRSDLLENRFQGYIDEIETLKSEIAELEMEVEDLRHELTIYEN